MSLEDSSPKRSGESRGPLRALLAALACALTAAAAGAATNCGEPGGPVSVSFPEICYRVFAGVPSSTGADSTVSRKVTIRWARDRVAEARPDFGGYRIYRQISERDTTNMELLRRFALHARSPGDTLANGDPNPSIYSRRDTLLWHFPDNLDTLQFVDPDSAGRLVKVCRSYDEFGVCTQLGDSVFRLIPPGQPINRPDLPGIGPHDGFPIYYTIVYGAIDRTLREVEELFVPDTLDNFARCNVPGDPTSCPNLNNKALNLMDTPVFVSGPATANVENVIVVPNPYRGRERWDQPGEKRVQFHNLPARSTVRIYTISGDLVRELAKDDAQSGNLDWNLKNAGGRDISSGIYIFHVVSDTGFETKGNFVVIL
ncbi:MAG: T9SS type A sorting domain-containing protein [Candidatus Eisenbacteria bacterium]